jgi:hypothetical protein
VISTGIDTFGALTVPLELGDGELEQPAMRPAVRMREEVRARRRAIRLVRTFMVVLRKATKIKAIRHYRRVYAGEDYRARGNFLELGARIARGWGEVAGLVAAEVWNWRRHGAPPRVSIRA